MKNNFIPYTEALALKELGFDEECLAYFDIVYEPFSQLYDGNLILGKDPECLKSQKQLNYIFGQQKMLAALYSQSFKFFRDKYNIDSKVERDCSLQDLPKQYCYIVETDEGFEESVNYKTYEEAELACLKKLIEICKNNIK